VANDEVEILSNKAYSRDDSEQLELKDQLLFSSSPDFDD